MSSSEKINGLLKQKGASINMTRLTFSAFQLLQNLEAMSQRRVSDLTAPTEVVCRTSNVQNTDATPAPLLLTSDV